jgi:hypothetical protein
LETEAMREERRAFYRFPVPAEHESAVLRVVDAELPGRLVDQSSTGFSIHLDRHPGCYAGEAAWLKTTSGWVEVRVVKVWQELDGTRVGLLRIGELAEPDPARGSAHPLRHLAMHQRSSVVAVGLALAVLAVLGCLVWMVVVKRYGRGSESGPGAETSAAASLRPAAVRALEVTLAHRHSELEHSIQQLSPTLLTLPDIVSYIQLTPEQQREIEDIARAFSESEQRLSSGAGGSKEAESLRQSALERVLSKLTPEQRAAWNEMVRSAVARLP